MTTDETELKKPLHRSARHWAGFLSSGGTAFLVDAAVLEIGTKLIGLGPLVARFFAIWAAMVVAWLMHRRLTFAIAHPPTVQEFLKYAAVAWVSSGVNYGVYAAIILALPATEPLLALFISSVVAMITSYLGMRFGVFQPRKDDRAQSARS